MTPLTRFFERYLPAPLVWPALCLSYAAMLGLLALFDPVGHTQIIYIDLRE